MVAVDRCADDPRLPYALGTPAELEAVGGRRQPRRRGRRRGRPAVVADASDARTTRQRRRGRRGAWRPRRDGRRRRRASPAACRCGSCRREQRAGGARGRPARRDRRRPRSRSRRCCAARSPAPAASSPSPRPPPRAACRCWPPTARPRPASAGFVRGLAAELRGTGVTANAVAPGSTRTPILDESARLYELGSAEEFAAQQPLERLIEPEEVAAVIVWLLGPGAAR